MSACQAVTHMQNDYAPARCREDTSGDVCFYHAKMANGCIDPITDESTSMSSKPVLVSRADTGEVLWAR